MSYASTLYHIILRTHSSEMAIAEEYEFQFADFRYTKVLLNTLLIFTNILII